MRLALIAAGLLASAWAQIFFGDKVEITFEAGKLSPEITWSDQMELAPSGLATIGPGAPNTSRDFWLQTQPMPAGPSWRPPRNVGMTVTLVGTEFGGEAKSGFLRVWGRYGADRVHWSSWFPLVATVGNLTATEFKGSMAKPYFAPSKYQDLMSAWWRTNPAWSSDEHRRRRP